MSLDSLLSLQSYPSRHSKKAIFTLSQYSYKRIIHRPTSKLIRYSCFPHGCDYFFDITFSGNSLEPGFTTTCRGSSYISGPQPCVDSSVSTSQVQGKTALITVQHVFTVGEASYWVQGQTTVGNDGSQSSFEVEESEFKAVA